MAAKKKTTKYTISRTKISSLLTQLVEDLSLIDTTNEAPNNVADSISDVIDRLEDLSDSVFDKA